ncbi:MAG: HDIG domain-containing protein [Nitrospiraceae bacterium]|nr:HDIG domain-containing protein [Nitrospiraceae bacterium]
MPEEEKSSDFFRTRTAVLAYALTFLLLTAAVTQAPELSREAIGYDIGMQPVALEEVSSTIDFTAEDLQGTKAKRDEAAASVPDVFRVDQERIQEQLRKLDERAQLILDQRGGLEQAVRDALMASDSSQTDADVLSKAVAEYAAKLLEDERFEGYPDAAVLSTWLMPAPDSLPRRSFAAPAIEGEEQSAVLPVVELVDPAGAAFRLAYANDLARLAREKLEYVLMNGVVERALSGGAPNRTITIIRPSPVGDLAISDELSIADVPGPEQAEEMLGNQIVSAAKAAAEQEDGPIGWAEMQTAAFEIAKPLIVDTLFFDQVATAGARERARNDVPPEEKQIQRYEVILRKGDRWTAQTRSDVRTYWAELEAQRGSRLRIVATLVAHMILVGLVLTCLVSSIRMLSPRRLRTPANLYLVFLVMTVTLLLGRLVGHFEPTGFVLPSAAGAILLAILLTPRIAVLTSLLTSVLVSIQFGYDWRLLIVGCAMSFAGVLGMDRVRKRSEMTSAAFKATAVGLLAVLAVTLAMDSLTSESSIRRVLLVLLNGAACLFIVPGVLSPLERLFGITTDIQLLEYSDLNNEVLSRMGIEIPATYAHSLMLGQLAEAASDAIGANGLMARVCAYYHDVGKLRRPEYFSENQMDENIHDQLPPRVSARAIASHVDCGVEFAREAHLPQPIINAIREHHGTMLIGYFYQRANELGKHDDIRQEDYRYPGPKPQSREVAILMICDAVESGIRSIKNPNQERVREFVDKIISTRSEDRQFDESDLTLRQLDKIKEVVSTRMMAQLHTRVAYPDKKKPDAQADNVVSISRGTT